MFILNNSCSGMGLIPATLLLQVGSREMIFENSKAQNGSILCYFYGL